MAGNSNIIREYLISLGWKIDESGQRKFATAIAVQTVALQELAKGLEEVAEKAVSFVARISDELEKLYFASQRTKASAQNIQALGFAAGQMGSTAEAATQSLENFARFIRTRPAGENFIQSLGVQTRDASGNLLDFADIYQAVGKKLASAPEYRALKLSEVLGTDYNTLQAMRAGLGQFSSQYLDMLKAVGMDSQSAAKSSHELMNAFRTLTAMGTILTSKFAAALGAKLKKPLDDLQKWFMAKLPVIGKMLDWLAGVFELFVDAIGRWARMVVAYYSAIFEWFRKLDPAAKQFIGTVAALAAALWLLSSPLALIGAVASAIFLLIDDYQTWRRGGKSLINWSQWDDEIQKAVAGIQDVVAKVTDLITFLGKLEQKLANFIKPENILGNLPKEIGDLIELLDALTSRNWGKIKIAAGHIGADENIKGFKDDRLPTGDTRGLRNNNPGNIEYGEFARKEGATGIEATPRDHSAPRFAVFESAEKGLNALADLLRKYASQGIDTVNTIVHKYAPKEDGNDEAAYAGSLSKRLGVAGTEHLNLGDPKILEGLMNSVIQFENGKNPYSREQVARAAGDTTNNTDNSRTGATTTTSNSRPITIHQSNVTTITGATDPAAMAKQNDRSKNSNNEMLIRQLAPVLQ